MSDDPNARIAELGRQLAQARETNARLNRRCQLAEAAAVDAKKCLERMSRDGVPWVGGSLGRGVLAWDCANLGAEIKRLQAIVDKLPTKQILAACKLIDEADQALFADGNVPPTARVLTPAQLQQCLSALWATRDAAEAAAEQSKGKA